MVAPVAVVVVAVVVVAVVCIRLTNMFELSVRSVSLYTASFALNSSMKMLLSCPNKFIG